MADSSKPSLRIDWFDGTVTQGARTTSSPSSDLQQGPSQAGSSSKVPYAEKKLMGFRKLLSLSQEDAPDLIIQLSGRTSFWDLLQSELKDDYVVLIVKIVAKLYSFLQSGQKSPMMEYLLRNKFATSTFVDRLCQYMLDLPQTRIINKKMNMTFWDDAESFYRNVLSVFDGIYVNCPKEAEEKVPKLICALENSIEGLKLEHRETFTSDLVIRVRNRLQKPALLPMPKLPSSTKIQSSDSHSESTNFHLLNILPTKQDLLGEAPCDLKPNIVDGAYVSVQHYLDIQFKLLREDFFGPLREGLSKYRENPTKTQHENIRVHPKVKIVTPYACNNKVGYLVDIAWTERQAKGSVDKKKHSQDKQLMCGSLLLFTDDNFRTILCATVLNSNMNLLSKGYIAVSFETPLSNNVFKKEYLMVESEVFFEPYNRVLKVLQDFSGECIPMDKYIVSVQPQCYGPSYLSYNTKYSILAQPTKTEISFPVLSLSKWPNNTSFGLDNSQMEAYKLALTREFAIIQGPPGTGKTFMGIKVATTLLQNLSLKGTPMLVVCLTNHALDQFLEGLLKVTGNIIRLGGQSKNPAIEPLTLNNARAKCKSRHGHLYHQKRMQQEKLFQELVEMQGRIEACDRDILSYNTIKYFLKINSKEFNLHNSYDEDPIIKWLFPVEQRDTRRDSNCHKYKERIREENEKMECNKDINVESCFSEKGVAKEIASLENHIKSVQEGDFSKEDNDKIMNEIRKKKIYLHIYKSNMRLRYKMEDLLDVIDVFDAYSLGLKERWFTYFKAVESLKESLLVASAHLQEKYRQSTQDLDELSTLLDAEVVNQARVVGLTTTMAARRHHLLQAIQSPIVIIEEAAEVLEAHIVASLTHHSKHVILIGDHKQLRPSAAHYELAKYYNMEISLFERMIRNGVHSRTLHVQRRMRPCFVDLIVPTIYDKLECHPDVVAYPNVRGMAKDLFFLTHSSSEDECTQDSRSHKNTKEAQWCVALANYLRQKKYSAEEVTILTTYNDQASLIKQFSQSYPLLQDCTITVVDNYQGEESRIVILSLVRSNKERKIGFLAAQNRICVALSRAKEGFYIFGNMKVLKSASLIWQSINEKLLAQNAIGKSLQLTCSEHPENTMDISKVEDFKDCLTGPCLKTCEELISDKDNIDNSSDDNNNNSNISYFLLFYFFIFILDYCVFL